MHTPTPMNTSKTTDRSKVKDSSPDMMVKKDEPLTTPKAGMGLSDKDVRAELPKTDILKTDTPKTDTFKADTSKTETPKGDVYKAEAPKTDSPKADIHKPDMPMPTEKAATRK